MFAVGSAGVLSYPLHVRANRAKVAALFVHPARALRLIEPTHIIMLGLAIALSGVIWQARKPARTDPRIALLESQITTAQTEFDNKSKAINSENASRLERLETEHAATVSELAKTKQALAAKQTEEKKITEPKAAPPKAEITWNFESGSGYLFGMDYNGGNVHIQTFQATGTNNADKPIQRVTSYIRSDVTNKSIPVYFVIDGDRVPPDETYGIPARAEFVVASSPISEKPNGIDASDFYTEFAPFTFVFEYDGKTYSRSFSRNDVRDIMLAYVRSIEPPSKKVPRVIKRGSEKR